MSSTQPKESQELFSYDDSDLKSMYEYSKGILNKSLDQIISEYDKNCYKSRDDYLNKKIVNNSSEVKQKFDEKNKGKVGQIIEKCFYGYNLNNKKTADFTNIPLEIKVTPYVSTKKKSKIEKSCSNNTPEITLKAKERLSLCMINYKNYKKVKFEESPLYEKCKNIIILFYEHVSKENILKSTIKYIGFYDWLNEDLPQIKKDYETISNKILEGKAHTISESDTAYLAASVKGKKGKDLRNQRFGVIPAKPRCWSLKPKYLNYLLNNKFKNLQHEEKLYGYTPKIPKITPKFESIAKNDIEKTKPFEDLIIEKFKPHFGKSLEYLLEKFDIKKESKNKANLLIRKILNLNENIELSEEFQKSNMLLRVIRVKPNLLPKEDSPFKVFRFKTLHNEMKWKQSQVYTEIYQKRIMFVLFVEDDSQQDKYLLKHVFFWGFPENLEDGLKRDWESVKTILGQKNNFSVVKRENGYRIKHKFPKAKECNVIFYKIHSSQSVYEFPNKSIYGKGKYINNKSVTNALPNGCRVSNHSFWLSKYFLQKIFKEYTDKLNDYKN
ncbi:Sau3AI family type II restriction endonuclease [Taylorella asinigenitalis]|uniref:Restriction enzyme n=1 Tax=Taylorella asinigenitalis (strain MCE3) TaxID=1008459 RepID=G4Q9F5_TAYAM|nr:Sau3AI family type II restriction endonuclease [Taylorella asinigenitalis]AEP36492.1 restriction enzyme [Taylorella asinigenitalis MCE3]